jgi:hypothetical protein
MNVCERSWYFPGGNQLVITRDNGIISHGELRLKMSGDDLPLLRVAGLKSPRDEGSDLDRVRVIDSKSGLIGVVVQPMYLYVGPGNEKNLETSWTEFVLPQNLCCVIDLRTGEISKIDLNSGKSMKPGIRDRFITQITSTKVENREVLSGIDSVELQGKYGRADVITSLKAIPTLHEISISKADLMEDSIDAIKSLSSVTVLWLEDVNFKGDSFQALARLNNLSRLNLNKEDVEKIPNADIILDRVRESLPNTNLVVRDSY